MLLSVYMYTWQGYTIFLPLIENLIVGDSRPDLVGAGTLLALRMWILKNFIRGTVVKFLVLFAHAHIPGTPRKKCKYLTAFQFFYVF
jgi:hypothetical protein